MAIAWALIYKKTRDICASKNGDIKSLEIFPTLKMARLELMSIKDKDKYTIVKISIRMAIRSDR